MAIHFGRNKDFIRRESILFDLLKRISPGVQKNNCQRTAIKGLNGVGKTQMAIEAAYRLYERESGCSVFWVPAVDMAMFESAYRDIGRRLGVPEIDDDTVNIKTIVKNALDQDTAGN
jgi:hypothetical protein